MALDKTTLKQTLKSLFEAGSNDSETMAEAIANAIDIFVKSGTVNVTVNGVTSPAIIGLPSSIISQPGTGSVT